MQVNVVSGGESAFNAILYGLPSKEKLDYLNNNLQQVVTSLNGASNYIATAAKQIYNKFNSNEAIEAAKAFIFSVGNHMDQNIIYPIYNQEGVYRANHIMQRYIMAQPDIYDLYKNDMCYGFSETYYDTFKDTILQPTEYRNAMSGITQFDKNGEGYIHIYSSSDAEELTSLEKYSVQLTWDTVTDMMNQGIDPTNPEEGSML